MKFVPAFAFLAAFAAVIPAHALDNLDMKLRCDYKVKTYEEVYSVNLPAGDDEAAATRIRENDIDLNLQILVLHDAENTNQLKLQVNAIKHGIKDGQTTYSREELLRAVVSINAATEVFEVKEGNSIACRPLTEEEVKQCQAEKDEKAAKEKAAAEEEANSEEAPVEQAPSEEAPAQE